MESWQRVLPGFQTKRWDEGNSPVEVPFLNAALDDRNWAFASDMVRLHALYEEGGVYLDTDMLLLKPLEPLLEHRLFLGFEDEQFVAAGIVGAQPFHPFIADALDHYRRAPYERKALKPIPRVLTRLLHDYGFRGSNGRHAYRDIDLYPSSYFYPFPLEASFEASADPMRYVREETIAVHLWNKSWIAWADRPADAYLEAGNFGAATKVLSSQMLSNPIRGWRFYKTLAAALAGYGKQRLNR